MKNASGWFCFVLLLGAVAGFSAGRWDVQAQSIDNKSTRYLAGTLSYGQGPVATAAGMSGAIHGSNSAGLALAKKNKSSGPRSSASLSMGLSCGRSFMPCV